MKINFSKSFILTTLFFVILFCIKYWSNFLLLAENGDTYDFFKIAYFIQKGDWFYGSKRMPFLPLLLAPFPSDWFIWVGRFWINLFYFASIFVFYKIINIVLIKSANQLISSPHFAGESGKSVNYIATVVFATNIIIFENSYYILADTIFLFFNLLFIYCILSKKDNPLLLAIITALSFYTRPEGFILGIVTTTYYLTQKKHKNIGYYVVTISVLLIPNLIKNYVITKNPFSSGYFNDVAGFIFDFETILKRISNFFFLTGGIFLFPLAIILLKIEIKKIKKIIIDPLFLIFLFNSIILFLWGPYPRLYSIPSTILIIFLTKMIFENQKRNKLREISMFIFFGILTFLFLYVSQNLNHNDFGYKKYSKLISIVISFVIITLPIIKKHFKISHNKFVLILGILIIILNLTIFVDKFRFTRYKYASIKNCVEEYLKHEKEGNLAYATLSGMEEWYLKDFENKYRYLGNSKDFKKWSMENNVTFIITTLESGHKDNIGHINLKNFPEHQVLMDEKTPFFSGSTKLIRLK